MYANGRGVPQDYSEAVRWYRKASEQGDTEAENNLAELYSRSPALRREAKTPPSEAPRHVVPAEARGIEAVAIIFSYAYRAIGPIEINDTATPPWSEARIKSSDVNQPLSWGRPPSDSAGRPKSQDKDFLLQRDHDDPCRFNLGVTVVNSEGVPTMGNRVAIIRFDKLSGETETTSRIVFGEYEYDLTVFGLPGVQAVCDIGGRHQKMGGSCYDRLNISGLSSERYRQVLRALHFRVPLVHILPCSLGAR
jgi:hypothetical protein